jgi:hypothetical protein
MRRTLIGLMAAALVSSGLAACGSDSSDVAGKGGASGGSGGSTDGSSESGGSTTGGSAGATSDGGGSTGDAGSIEAPSCDQVLSLAQAYKAAHPGNGGKDWDILTKTPDEIAADPDAQKLLALCGKDERPIIPVLVWEYGGSDHAWINPQASAPVYCVYVPVNPSTAHWQYDAVADHVTADVYVRCPDQNPCKDETGANQVMSCLGDPTNIEIFVDIASLDDGIPVGLQLSEASTDLNLILTDGSKVHLYTGF